LSAAENFVTRLIILTAILLSLHACGEQQPGETLRFDIVIENGLVLDGSGSDAIETDVFIHAGEIVRIDELDVIAASNQVEIGRRIDADGRIVAPGFIDVHSHGDPLQTPDFENFLAQGVTTITLGQDGSSPASENLSEWMNEVEAQGIGVNLAMFVGHGTLRELSGIGRDPVPSPEQLQRMLEMLEHNLEVSFGMSAGLEYNPGLNAAETELLALAEVVGRHDRVIMSHMRNEDDDAIEASLAELLAQGEYARVHVAHMKSVYGRGAARAEELLALMQEARDRGISDYRRRVSLQCQLYRYRHCLSRLGQDSGAV
jgi:N-acyl-D-aspartate/D-glutamate deacylase